jgi:hypothetical protein
MSLLVFMCFLTPKACHSTAKVRFDLFKTTLGPGFRIVHKNLDTDFTNHHEFNSRSRAEG